MTPSHSPSKPLNPSLFSPHSCSSSSPPLLLNQLNVHQICIFAILTPVGGLIAIFIVALCLHSSQLFAYEWTCGTAYLPSVSRVLNLPAERIIWNFVICLHIPMRLLITIHYYFSFQNNSARHAQKLESSAAVSRLCSTEQYLRLVFLISGFSDHFFLVCLSAVGERENAELHVIFFSSFLFSTFIHFTSHFYLEDAIGSNNSPRGKKKKGKMVRMFFLAFLWLLVPFIVICFALHELYCAKFSYELFALGEYLTIATIFGFNSAILLDNHSNCFFLAIVLSKSPKQIK